MKAFLLGLLGALTVVIAVIVGMPLYENHTQRVITSEIYIYIEPQTKEIEKSLLSKKEIVESVSVNPAKYIQYLSVQNNGVIVVKATDEGQMLVLKPTVKDNAVLWQCIGSPNLWVPPKCRGT